MYHGRLIVSAAGIGMRTDMEILKIFEYYNIDEGILYNGNCLEILKLLPNESINCCITSPPYWGLRDYGHNKQIGIEKTPDEYVSKMVSVFAEVKRVLKPEGTLWLNLGDSYVGTGAKGDYKDPKNPNGRNSQKEKAKNNKVEMLKSKDLVGIPWRVAFALQSDGWYLRQDIIWHKPNPMPESVTDRCTKAHEYIFLLSKSKKYYFDNASIKEKSAPDNSIRNRDLTKLNNTPGRTKMKGLIKNDYKTRNKRSVWTVSTKPFSEAHFATFPPDLIEPCVKAGCPIGGVILDPFFGAGTTGYVAVKHDRKFIGLELNKEYCEIAKNRIEKEAKQTKLFKEA